MDLKVDVVDIFVGNIFSVSVEIVCVFELSLFKFSFPQQGTGPEVPKFLRYEGQVRNRRLGKRDTSLLIKDIWQEKAAHDAEVREIVQGHLFLDKLYYSVHATLYL